MAGLLKTGVLSLHGLFVAVAVVAMIMYAFYYNTIKKYDHTPLMYITPAAIFFGFFGARFMYVTVCDQLYMEAAEKWRLTDGGYALFGAAAGVILTIMVFWLITKRRFRLLEVFDPVCAAAPLAITIGRMGSVFSQDCMGEAVDHPGLRFFPVAIMKQLDGEYHYAVFFYEAVFCLVLFFVMRFADKRIDRPGVSSFLFAVMYCGGRAFFESMREDSMYVGFVKINQVIAILTVIGLFVCFCIRLCKRTRFKPVYLISYALFTAAFVVSFFMEFYMYSDSKTTNTIIIMICCIVMEALTVFTGAKYLQNTENKKARRKIRA